MYAYLKSQRLALAGAILLALFVPANAAIAKRPFGKTQDGTPVDLYTLTSGKLEATITNYGGRIVTLKTPDRSGKVTDIVLGFDNLDGYLKENPYFGALVGRYANRIANGEFSLDGKTYHVPKNDGANSLHGGIKGFDKKVWNAQIEGDTLVLHYLSRDGEEGYPGNLNVTVRYKVSGNELRIAYEATTDKDTVLNLSNHSYFNLKGQGDGDILGHSLTLYANRFTPVNAALIPTGELSPVSGTPFDFTRPHLIGERIGASNQQLEYGRGYDHNWVLNPGAGVRLAARVEEPSSGRVMEVLTDQPGLQFYTGNFLDGTIHGKGGKVYGRRYAFCMETQHFPDSPNHPKFPTTELKPGQQFRTTTVFRFSSH